MTLESGTSFAVLLRSLRKAAFLTQEDLAHAARLSSRRSVTWNGDSPKTTRRDTANKLADALNLTGSSLEDFVAAALDAARQVSRPRASGDAIVAGSRFSGEPREWLSHVVSTLDELGVAAAQAAVEDWQAAGLWMRRGCRGLKS